MEPIVLIIAAIAFFLLFLMLTAWSQKHRLEKALTDLESERLSLMKSIQHIKLCFYQRKLGEKEAQDKIFELEETLKNTEERILQIKEKPLMRTLDKQEEEKLKEIAASQPDGEIKQELVAVVQDEKKMASNMSAKAIVILFVAVLVAIIIAMAFIGKNPGLGGSGPIPENIDLPVSARIAPVGGTYPGGSAGLWVDIENTWTEDIKEVIVIVAAPESSGITIDGSETSAKVIPMLEKGGLRELFFYITVNKTTEDGQYAITANAAAGEVQLGKEARTIIEVRTGAPTNPGGPLP